MIEKLIVHPNEINLKAKVNELVEAVNENHQQIGQVNTVLHGPVYKFGYDKRISIIEQKLGLTAAPAERSCATCGHSCFNTGNLCPVSRDCVIKSQWVPVQPAAPQVKEWKDGDSPDLSNFLNPKEVRVVAEKVEPQAEVVWELSKKGYNNNSYRVIKENGELIEQVQYASKGEWHSGRLVIEQDLLTNELARLAAENKKLQRNPHIGCNCIRCQEIIQEGEQIASDMQLKAMQKAHSSFVEFKGGAHV